MIHSRHMKINSASLDHFTFDGNFCLYHFFVVAVFGCLSAVYVACPVYALMNMCSLPPGSATGDM